MIFSDISPIFMFIFSFRPSYIRRASSLMAALLLLGAIASMPAIAQDDLSLQTVEIQGTQQRTLAGLVILNDVIARDSSQMILSRNADTGTNTEVDGNTLALDGATIFISDTRVAGNVNASEQSVIVIEQSEVDGNIEVNGDAMVALGPQTVVSGNIEGVFIGTDASGYAIYVGQ